MPELDVAPMDAAPANPRDWAGDAPQATPQPGADPAVHPHTPPPAPAIERKTVAAAVRAVHWTIWGALRSEECVPIADPDREAIVDGLLPLAERYPQVAKALEWAAIPDPEHGIPRWLAVERRAHEELLPEPLGTGKRETDGWIKRVAAWLRGLADRRVKRDA